MDIIAPNLYIVIPCYNEQEVLHVTAPLFLKKLMILYQRERLETRAKFCLLMMDLRIVHGRLFPNYLRKIAIIWA